MARKLAHPSCYIIAGPNGAGKATFATELLPLDADYRNFIHPDPNRERRPFGPFFTHLRRCGFNPPPCRTRAWRQESIASRRSFCHTKFPDLGLFPFLRSAPNKGIHRIPESI